MISTNSDQISINSYDFGDNLEFNALVPTIVVYRYFATSASEEQRIWGKFFNWL